MIFQICAGALRASKSVRALRASESVRALDSVARHVRYAECVDDMGGSLLMFMRVVIVFFNKKRIILFLFLLFLKFDYLVKMDGFIG